MPEPKTVKAFVKGNAKEVQAEIVKSRGKGRVAKADMIRQGSTNDKVRLTPKETEFLKGKLQGKSTTQAALDAYDTDDPVVASSIGQENLQKPRIKQAMAEALEEIGATPVSMAQILKDAMSATKTASMQGEVFASDEPDHSVRISAVKTAVEMIDSQSEDGSGKPTFNFFGGQTFVKKAEVHNQ